MENCGLPAGSFMTCSVCFCCTSKPHAQGWRCLQWVGPPTPIANQRKKKSPTVSITGQFYGGIFSIKVLFPDDPSLCQADKNLLALMQGCCPIKLPLTRIFKILNIFFMSIMRKLITNIILTFLMKTTSLK